MPLLELKNIVYGAAGRPGSRILDDLSLSVEAGEVHALLGTNGTGKSTLASLIMGCEGYVPATGQLLFDGRDISSLTISERARLGISMTWQEPVRFEGITVSQYLGLGGRVVDAAAALQLSGLNPVQYANRLVDRSLSGGERKRIELASVFALHPKLAILDEPDSGIDMLSTADIINIIKAFKARGAAVLLITHREEIALIADHASQLCDGRIICSGTPEKVANHYKLKHCLACDRVRCHYV